MIQEKHQNGYVAIQNEIRIFAFQCAKSNHDEAKKFKAAKSLYYRFMKINYFEIR